MKVCVVSDSHDRADSLAHAVGEARELGAQAVIHCGDLIGAQTILAALEHGLPIHLIHGNNLGDAQATHRQARKSAGAAGRGAAGVLHYHGAEARLELAGRRIFVVHYDHYGYAMACTGEWDLVCCGHSHHAEVKRVPDVKGGSSWLVNPGTVAGLAAPCTWVMADLAAMSFDVRELGRTRSP
ncbi:MAG TPA: metallophosphoesterase family protein [Rubrivivax sp.]|nr:metallophosphoesterase family protein [Rubrivivax sp.]